MKKFKTKSKKKGIIIFFFLFILGIFLSFKYIESKNINFNDKDLVNYLLSNFKNKNSGFTKILSVFKNNDISSLIKTNYSDLVPNVQPINHTNTSIPLIYLYNSHQKEDYKENINLDFQIKPTVMVADYILKDVFDKNNLFTIVEENSISDIINLNNWKYYKSYDASRILMNAAKSSNPTLEYFIDIHRDSLPKDKTKIEIAGKSYAKTIFLIGLENPNYEENLAFTAKINERLNVLYPGLSKGIYKKGGRGVNGVYNQDFSKHTILIEIGGYDNTLDEVLNSTLAFSKAFMEALNENDG